MQRIGIAASKIAKGNLTLYNIYVVLIALLFSIFLFVLTGTTVLFALVIISYISNEIMPIDFMHVIPICVMTLTVVVTLFNLMALSKNLKFTRNKNDQKTD